MVMRGRSWRYERLPSQVSSLITVQFILFPMRKPTSEFEDWFDYNNWLSHNYSKNSILLNEKGHSNLVDTFLRSLHDNDWHQDFRTVVVMTHNEWSYPRFILS